MACRDESVSSKNCVKAFSTSIWYEHRKIIYDRTMNMIKILTFFPPCHGSEYSLYDRMKCILPLSIVRKWKKWKIAPLLIVLRKKISGK